ncbi:hypothetical protein K503DRAFT_774450 [Rhizopogon vinicolor AM-OR11-026]|uniref:Uncharacterized protein n=1 Tax=Rhizopogon vinicolor AM-OR11-026 TaxID=1314800 RepID=A0A1B7MPJ3_9AGAM|nr:hypothetical protein K503DRAFT_774450 [Rhizopogon vinicolor AM-OR11-026]
MVLQISARSRTRTRPPPRADLDISELPTELRQINVSPCGHSPLPRGRQRRSRDPPRHDPQFVLAHAAPQQHDHTRHSHLELAEDDASSIYTIRLESVVDKDEIDGDRQPAWRRDKRGMPVMPESMEMRM